MPNTISIANMIGSSQGTSVVPFDPKSIAGLTLWVKADANVYSDAGTTPVTNGGTVQQWNDQLVSPHNLSGTGTAKPTYNTGVKNGLPIITFNGTTNSLGTVAFTMIQPLHVFMMWRQVTFVDGGSVHDGVAGYNTMRLVQNTTSPNITMQAGGTGPTLTTLSVNTFGITDEVYNGASSSIRLNNGSKVTANAGAANPGGFFIGSDNNGPLHFANIGVGEVLIYNTQLSDANAALVINYLNSKWAVF